MTRADNVIDLLKVVDPAPMTGLAANGLSPAMQAVIEAAVYCTDTPNDAENTLIIALAALVGRDDRETLALAVKLAKVIGDHRRLVVGRNNQAPSAQKGK
jgi:hypothetical protein